MLRAGTFFPSAVVEQIHHYLDASFAETTGTELCLLHGDCLPDHFFLAPGTGRVTGLIDFGDSVLGDPIWDLAVLTLWDPDKLPFVLDGYQPDEQMQRRMAALLHPYQLLRHLRAAHWMRDHGYSDEPDLEAARRGWPPI
jgi:aminoglycoside phosphotransferase (APT) family kinase protein